MQGEQYIPEAVFHWRSYKSFEVFKKLKKSPPWSSSFVFVDGFVYYVDELLPNDEKY